ncbi:Cytochrome P450 [Musa troglodytarum]|uniref:Cytochrome P450 n=1 Tax=Musa troglodytarum TaxID=320322 RepID=A0A9E7GJ52_9LILI|nr:Cytochrome P450 [Musa troglodytarum]
MEIPSSAIYLAILLVFTVLTALAGGRRRHKLNLPPGPRPWPVIGNLNHIGRRPYRSLAALSQNSSSKPMTSFVSRPKTASGMFTTYNCSDITWSPYGPYWRQARRICFMELFTPKRLDSHQYIRVEEVRCLLRDLFRSAETPVLLKDHLFTMNLNIMSRMVLGRKYTQEQSLSSGAPAAIVPQKEFKEMIEELMLLNSVINVGDLIPWLNFLDLQGYVKRMKMLSKRFDRFLEHVLVEHNERRRREGKAFVSSNMVDVLLELADDHSLEVKLERHCLKAFILDMLVGGTDIPTMTIERAIAEILKRPETFDMATEELDRVIGRGRWVEEEDVHRLPYIEAIVKESMRMHPVAPLLIPRLSREHTTVDGYDIPAGTGVLVNMWAIGRDPAVWDDPEEFRPERFLGSPIDVQGHHFELLPSGAGRRMCPGKAFVSSNMVDVLLVLADDPNLEVKLERHCLKAFILDMLVGGTDTSTMTIERAISEILKRPETFDMATAELDRVIGRGRWVEEEDVHSLPYIEAIAKETMRMHPVAPLLVPRLSREHTTVDGYDIPAGTGVLVNVWAIGRDPAVWDAPEEFRPERFVGSPIDVKGHHFELLPFGAVGGCAPLVHLSLANLLHGFKWRLPPGMTAEELNMDEMIGVTAPRKVPLQAVVKPKFPAHLYGA